MARQKTDMNYHSNQTSVYMADALDSPSKDDPISANPMYGLVGNSSPSDMDTEKEDGNSKALGLAFRDGVDGIYSLHSEIELGKPGNIQKHSVLALGDICSEAIQRTEDRILLEQVETDAAPNQKQSFQDYGDTYTEKHFCCTKASERYCQKEEDALNGGSTSDVRNVGGLLLEATVECGELTSHKNNTEHLDKDTTNKDLTVETVDPNRADVAICNATNLIDDVSYEGPSTYTRSGDTGYMYGKYTDDLLVKKEIQVVVNEADSSNKILYELRKRDEKVKKKIALTIDTDLALSDAGSTDIATDNYSQFFVECENGIKLYVDLKNKTPVEWVKTQSYEFCSSEQLHEHYAFVQTPKLKATQGLNISKDADLVADKKIKSAKLTKSHVMDEGKPLNLHSTAGDCHQVHTFSRAGRFASSPPPNVTRKFEVSRELRRMSSVLIPPHGANRCLSPLMSYGASRLSSPLISHGANRFFSLSSEARCCRPQTYDNQQIAQGELSSEQCMPTMALASNAVEEVSVPLRAVDKELLREKKQSDFPTVKEMNETAVPYSDIEAEAAKCPSMNDAELEDVDMLDHELCAISETETYNSQSQQQQVAHCQEEDGQNTEKDIGWSRIMQIQIPESSKREMNCLGLVKNFETKEERFISRYKNDYKKLPFGKSLRRMKNLARVSSMRVDILTNKRSTPCMFSAYPNPSRLIKCVHSVTQAAEEMKGAPVSSLKEKCKEVAPGSQSVLLSPVVYEERDLCDSVLLHSDTSQNTGSISASARVGQEGSRKTNQSKQKLEGWPFLGFGRRRFLQRALADSARRLKAQKMLRSGVYDRYVTQEEVTGEVLGDKETEFSQESHDTKLNMLESEEDLYSERMTEKQTRHHGKFKTSLIGKSREKGKKIAKKMAVLRRREILSSKRGIMLTDMSDCDVQENLDHPLKELSINVLHQIHNISNGEVTLI